MVSLCFCVSRPGLFFFKILEVVSKKPFETMRTMNKNSSSLWVKELFRIFGGFQKGVSERA